MKEGHVNLQFAWYAWVSSNLSLVCGFLTSKSGLIEVKFGKSYALTLEYLQITLALLYIGNYFGL